MSFNVAAMVSTLVAATASSAHGDHHGHESRRAEWAIFTMAVKSSLACMVPSHAMTNKRVGTPVTATGYAAMLRFSPITLLLLLVAACAKGPEADLQYISEARSLAAEWALVNAEAGQGKLTATYIATMRRSVREQLSTASSTLTEPDSRYGAEIRALLAEPDAAPPEELRAHADKLKQIEDGLESA